MTAAIPTTQRARARRGAPLLRAGLLVVLLASAATTALAAAGRAVGISLDLCPRRRLTALTSRVEVTDSLETDRLLLRNAVADDALIHRPLWRGRLLTGGEFGAAP